jgi:hypothetical protein
VFEENVRCCKTHTKTSDNERDEEPGPCTEQLPAVEDGDDNEKEAGDDSGCFGRNVFVERVLRHGETIACDSVCVDRAKYSVQFEQLGNRGRVCAGMYFKSHQKWTEQSKIYLLLLV